MNITHMYTHIYFVIIIEYINTFPIYLISASYKISNKQTNIQNWTLFTASMAQYCGHPKPQLSVSRCLMFSIKVYRTGSTWRGQTN